MQTFYDDNPFEDQNKQDYQTARYKEWLKLRETEQKLFVAVVKAWKKNKNKDRWDQKEALADWITREQIADELGAARLIPYYLKLLDHLSDGKTSRDHALNWIQRTKRSRFRLTYEGRKRPAGYEWVYYPDKEVIEALNTMNPNNQKQEAAPKPASYELLYKQSLWDRLVSKISSFIP